MLEASARLAEVVALALAGAGVVIVAYALMTRRGIVVAALGALVTASALAAPLVLRKPPVDVVVVSEDDGGKVAVRRTDGFYDGAYVTRAGRRVPVSRERAWGPTATLIINDSSRLLRVTAYQYSEFKHAPGRPQLMTYVLPLTMRASTRRIEFTGSETDGPPAEITSPSRDAAVMFLSYSLRPYDAAVHGDADALQGELEAPPGPKPVSLAGD